MAQNRNIFAINAKELRLEYSNCTIIKNCCQAVKLDRTYETRSDRWIAFYLYGKLSDIRIFQAPDEEVEYALNLALDAGYR